MTSQMPKPKQGAAQKARRSRRLPSQRSARRASGGRWLGRYYVEDHPFDRGYFDRVLNRPNTGGSERSDKARRQYRLGWRTADQELASESRTGLQ
jgi:hypothetical protein